MMRLIPSIAAFAFAFLLAGCVEPSNHSDEYIDDLSISELAKQIIELGPKDTFVLYEGRQQRFKISVTGKKLPPLPPHTLDNRSAPEIDYIICHYTRPVKIKRFDADHIESVVESSGTFECQVRPDNSVIIIDKGLLDNPDWPLNQRLSDSKTSLPETMTAVGLRDFLISEFGMEPRPVNKDDSNAPIVLRRDEITNETRVRDLVLKWVRTLPNTDNRVQVVPSSESGATGPALGWSTLLLF